MSPHDGPAATSESQLADDELLRLLGQALAVGDPIPDHVLAAARGAVAWRTIDQELADLVFDSALEATGVRDPEVARQLTFRSGGVEIEVMLFDDATRRVVGQVIPATATGVRLETTDATVSHEADRYGRFSFEGVGTGPVRFGVEREGAPVVVTDWVLL